MDSLRRSKRCFVTVGATASFTSLVRAVLDESFLEILKDHGYTELRVQYGKDSKKFFEDLIWVMPNDLESRLGITISGFDFKREGLQEEMKATKKISTQDKSQGELSCAEGCVISHAGSGSILDALRIELPIIVVPNPDLLHNHQLELAEVLAEQNYVVNGDLRNLAAAIPQVERLRQDIMAWPPTVGSNKKTPKAVLMHVMNYELGYD